jgi:hypothetical protein
MLAGASTVTYTVSQFTGITPAALANASCGASAFALCQAPPLFLNPPSPSPSPLIYPLSSQGPAPDASAGGFWTAEVVVEGAGEANGDGLVGGLPRLSSRSAAPAPPILLLLNHSRAVFRTGETKIENRRDAELREGGHLGADLRLAAADALHRPFKARRFWAIHPEKARHPIVDREAQAAQLGGERHAVMRFPRAGCPANKVDEPLFAEQHQPARVRLRKTSSKSGSRVETSAMPYPAACTAPSTSPALATALE